MATVGLAAVTRLIAFVIAFLIAASGSDHAHIVACLGVTPIDWPATGPSASAFETGGPNREHFLRYPTQR